MKIAFFEIEGWEKSYFEEKLSGHELYFDEQALTEENAGKVTDFDILSGMIYSEFTKDVLGKMTHVKMITTRSTGFDHIDLEYCKSRTIVVCNVPEYGSNTVAEHTFALILAVARNLIPSVERTKRGDFDLKGLRGIDLYGKTLGIVGVGNIGKAVIRIAKGFGMNVIAYTRNPSNDVASELGVEFVSFEDLLHKSDVVSLHVPYNKSTHHLINKENIHEFKKGSILINTARGGIVETEAVLIGLDEEILRGVGLDVLEEECMVKEERQLLTEQFLKECDIRTQLLNHVLLTKEKAIITPHNAFNSTEALERIVDTTTKNIISFVESSPINVVG